MLLSRFRACMPEVLADDADVKAFRACISSPSASEVMALYSFPVGTFKESFYSMLKGISRILQTFHIKYQISLFPLLFVHVCPDYVAKAVACISQTLLLLLAWQDGNLSGTIHLFGLKDSFKSQYGWVLYSPSKFIEDIDQRVDTVVILFSVSKHGLPICLSPGSMISLCGFHMTFGAVTFEV